MKRKEQPEDTEQQFLLWRQSVDYSGQIIYFLNWFNSSKGNLYWKRKIEKKSIAYYTLLAVQEQNEISCFPGSQLKLFENW